MKRLIDTLRRYWSRFLDDLMRFNGIEPGEDERGIEWAADYERDLTHDTGEDEFDTWIQRDIEAEERLHDYGNA